MTGYELSRNWFDWCFENPNKINSNHSALFFFCIEHCNRMGWKQNFGLPTTMAKEAIGIRSYNTYINTLNDLIDWGFIKLVEKSKNQYSSNIIALSNFNKATDKALDKALIKHTTKQSESTIQSISSIDKPITVNKEPITTNNGFVFPFDSLEFKNTWEKLCLQKKWKKKSHDALKASLGLLSQYYEKDSIQMMQNAIAGEYQGLFEIKGSKKRPDHEIDKELPF